MSNEKTAEEIIHDMMNKIQAATSNRREQLAVMMRISRWLKDAIHDRVNARDR